MNLLHSISDFIELYLAVDLPKKEIDLIKVRSFTDLKNQDELAQSVTSFQKALRNAHKHYVKHRTRTHHLPRPGISEKLEQLLELSPEDFLLVLAPIRYQMSLDSLSLILKMPMETLAFQTRHLREKLGFSDQELTDLHHQIKPVEKRRFSPIQTLRNRFRIQAFFWESAVIMLAIIIALWSVPELRNSYDRWIQKKTSEYFVSGEIKDAPIPPELNSKPQLIEPEASSATEENSSPEASKAERKQPKASEGEVWRFSFTGSAKFDLEKELKEILQKYTSQNPRASIAPGGIQLDAYIKVSDLVPLKIEFESVADTQSQTLKMSWYKKKMATKKVPSGQVEVVIWISTI